MGTGLRIPKKKIVRSFDDQSRVLTIDDYTYNTSKSEWIPSRSRAYDYVHDGSEYDTQGSVVGHCIKDITWRERQKVSGELFKDGFVATWYAPLDLYVKCSYSSDYKDELTINDKGYINRAISLTLLQISGLSTARMRFSLILLSPASLLTYIMTLIVGS